MPPKRNALNDDRVPSHGSKFLRKMDEFRAAGILCDVTLESKDGRSFAVHKVVLAAFSPYFQAMFANDMRESKEDKVKLDVDGKILSEVIRFAYTSQLTLSKTMKNIKAALIVANMLLLEDVEKICVESIIEGLNKSNCVEFIELAEYLSCEMLSQNVLQYLEKNFADVAAHEGFLSLPLKYLAKLLASEGIKMRSGEAEVLQAALSWLRHDTHNRKAMSYDVLRHVRLPLIERETLFNLIEPELNYLRESGCSELLDEVDSYQLDPKKRSLLQSQLRTQPRRSCPRELCIVGGISGSIDSPSISAKIDCCTLEENKQWQSLAASMTISRESAAVVVLDGLIYVIGGVSSDDNLSSVECYNPQLKSWSRVASLNLGKGQVSGALLDGQIYAVGGTDDELREGLKTVERYCVGSDKWEPVSPMHTGRGALGVAVLSGKLFACGGASFDFAFSSVEVYDYKRDRWSRAANMKKSRAFLDVVSLSGYLYALGGAEMENGQVSGRLESIERAIVEASVRCEVSMANDPQLATHGPTAPEVAKLRYLPVAIEKVPTAMISSHLTTILDHLLRQ